MTKTHLFRALVGEQYGVARAQVATRVEWSGRVGVVTAVGSVEPALPTRHPVVRLIDELYL